MRAIFDVILGTVGRSALMAIAAWPSVGGAAESCAYYRQQIGQLRASAQQNRAYAAQNRAVQSQARMYLAAAQAQENAIAQYEQRLLACGQRASRPTAGGDAPEQIIRQFGDLLQSPASVGQGDNEATARAAERAMDEARRRAAQRGAAYSAQQQSNANATLNERIDREMATERLNRLIEQQMAQDANPRLVDPDCAIAGSLAALAKKNLDEARALARVGEYAATLPGGARKGSEPEKVAQYEISAKRTERDYRSCLGSPPVAAAVPPASRSSTQVEIPRVIEFTGRGGEIAVYANRITAIAPDASADARARDDFARRLEALRKELGEQTGATPSLTAAGATQEYGVGQDERPPIATPGSDRPELRPERLVADIIERSLPDPDTASPPNEVLGIAIGAPPGFTANGWTKFDPETRDAMAILAESLASSPLHPASGSGARAVADAREIYDAGREIAHALDSNHGEGMAAGASLIARAAPDAEAAGRIRTAGRVAGGSTDRTLRLVDEFNGKPGTPTSHEVHVERFGRGDPLTAAWLLPERYRRGAEAIEHTLDKVESVEALARTAFGITNRAWRAANDAMKPAYRTFALHLEQLFGPAGAQKDARR